MNRLFQRRDIWIGLTAGGMLLAAWWQHRPWGRPGELNASAVNLPARPINRVPKPAEAAGFGFRLNTNELAALVERWRQTGLPDPMGCPPALASPIGSNVWAGFETLKLSGIWVQPARRLAVINQQVVGEGESIGGFRLERCESGGVWIAGSGASRRLAFTRPCQETTPAIADRAPRRSATASLTRQHPSP